MARLHLRDQPVVGDAIDHQVDAILDAAVVHFVHLVGVEVPKLARLHRHAFAIDEETDRLVRAQRHVQPGQAAFDAQARVTMRVDDGAGVSDGVHFRLHGAFRHHHMRGDSAQFRGPRQGRAGDPRADDGDVHAQLA